jgi:hypothetical protein
MSNIQQNMFGAEQEQLTKDDHYTPKWIFDAMGLEFDIDVASPPGGVPWIPKKRYFTRADDGLTQTWEGRIWCNPPFSKPGPWVDRMLEHGNGVLLACVSKSQWMDRLWSSSCAFVMLPSMLKFERPDGSSGISWPTFVAAFGPENIAAIARIGRAR